MEGGGGTGRRRRRLRVLALLLALLLVAPPAWVLLRVPRVEVEGLATSGRPFHVLIVGSDSRADLSPEERIALTTGRAGGERADTIMVMSVSGGRVGLLAIPRDLVVTRCDGTSGRVNAALGIGGPGCLARTVTDLTGLPIRHVVLVTFGGFRDVVDAVGGVRLCLEAPIRDRKAGIDLPAGCEVLDGADALGYVRTRAGDGDLARITRQQQFLAALARELLDPTLLVRPWRVARIAEGIGAAVTVDRGLGPLAGMRVAVGVALLATGRAVTHTVPATPATTAAGASVLRIRADEADALFRSFRDGSALRG
jgi:LCP family protein required for cell wall assembly